MVVCSLVQIGREAGGRKTRIDGTMGHADPPPSSSSQFQTKTLRLDSLTHQLREDNFGKFVLFTRNRVGSIKYGRVHSKKKCEFSQNNQLSHKEVFFSVAIAT